MENFRKRWPFWLLGIVIAMTLAIGSDNAAAVLDPNAEVVLLPQDMKWSGSPTQGAQVVTLYGDPDKPGLYIQLTKWHAGGMSHPHFHPNDRFITVVSGTWWKGTGTKYDPPSTTPIPAGSFVIDKAKGIHYDGSKEGDVVLEIVGMGPATNTDAEVK
jgi:hypothetical protein